MIFNRKLSADSFTNLIAHGTSIGGTINFTGALKIEGKVTGDLIAGSDDIKNEDAIIVSITGEVASKSVTTVNAIIAGKVTCKELRCEDTLRVLSTADIKGASLYYRTLEIEPGAIITDCQMFHLDHVSCGEII